jgi:hypothetical protein
VDKRGLIAVAVAVLIAGACSGRNGETEQRQPPPDTAAQELLGEIENARPGVVLQEFARAVARRDERRMWNRLSMPTRQRLGPTLNGFRRRAQPGLERELAGLGQRNELLLSERITASFAVAAVGRAKRAYAAALRRENGLWRIELASPVRIEPLRPEPGETVARRTQLAAEVKAGTAIVEAGLWLDGVAFPSRGGGPMANALTMFGETSALDRGPHFVIAFASTQANASARAWAFRAGG